jgi:hypothetical protein
MMKSKKLISMVLMLLSYLSVSAWTMQATEDKNSGIENATLIAKDNNGTITGYMLSSGKATFVGAIPSGDMISVPDTLICGTKTYVVATCGTTNKPLDVMGKSIYRLFLPPSITRINQLPAKLFELFLRGQVQTLSANLDNVQGLSCVYVPPSMLDTYLNDTKWANFVLIMPESNPYTAPLQLKINMTHAGELAQIILEKTDNWLYVKELSISGPLSQEDLNVVKKMRQLTVLDLSEAVFNDIPDYFCGASNTGDNRKGLPILKKVLLPDLETIGHYAFAQCNHLENVNFGKVVSIGKGAFSRCALDKYFKMPDGLTSIDESAFFASKLHSVFLPSTLTEIPYGCFENCDSLVSVSIPASVTYIGSQAFENTGIKHLTLPGVQEVNFSAFQGCKQLVDVTILSPNLNRIANNAFSGCSSLEWVKLSGSLMELENYVFKDCLSLRNVSCFAVIPPITGSVIFTGCNMEQIELYVPGFAIDAYRTAKNWKECYKMYPLQEKINVANIYEYTNIDDGSLFDSHCSLFLQQSPFDDQKRGLLEFSGHKTLSMDNFMMSHELGSYYFSSVDNYGYSAYTSLISNGPMRAGNVQTALTTCSEYIWYFISLPFDVKVSDISYPEDTRFVVRTYSGYNRANGGQNTWINLTNDSIMHAYQGYIFRCNNYWTANFVFQALDNGNKNNIFAKDDVKIKLAEYPSEFTHNSSWNLIGNPYPCYYDIMYMDFTAPITIWNRSENRYDAKSPLDDHYLLDPAQAFFVQKPTDRSFLSFRKEGRQLNRDNQSLNLQALPHHPSDNSGRQVFNLQMKGNDAKDLTRVVLNNQASCGYDMDKDAPKFSVEGGNPMMLYTIYGGVNYAINERPFEGGDVILGINVPFDGEYVISLSTTSPIPVFITDHLTGNTAKLVEEYTFMAEKGTDNNRFTLSFGDPMGIDEINNIETEIHLEGRMLTTTDSFIVYSADGRRVISGDAGQSVLLPQGFYVVSVNGKNRKIMVR